MRTLDEIPSVMHVTIIRLIINVYYHDIRVNVLSSFSLTGILRSSTNAYNEFACRWEIVSNLPYILYLYRENKIYTGRTQLICIIHNLWLEAESAGCARITKGQKTRYSRIRTLRLLSGFVNATGFNMESVLNWIKDGHSVIHSFYENVCLILFKT